MGFCRQDKRFFLFYFSSPESNKIIRKRILHYGYFYDSYEGKNIIFIDISV